MKKYKLLLPLFLIYLLVGIFFIHNHLGGDDEARYWRFANNLAHGFYTSTSNIDLTNGPGYPIFILPFVLLKSAISIPKFLNVILMFFAILFFYKTLLFYINEKRAIIFSYVLGLYIPMYKYISRLETEMMAFFLIAAIVYYFCKTFKYSDYKLSNVLILSFLIFYLTMTKIFFGYVIIFSIIFTLILYLKTKNKIYQRAIYIFFLAFILCLPYLFYTYTLTGKVLYWATNGGDTFYSSVSPYADEYGDYIIGPDIFDTTTAISKNHFSFVNPIKYLSQFKKDQIYKAKAIEILKEHPFKYIFNWFNNLGRLIFNYPYSHTLQKPGTYFYIIPNSFLFVLTVFLLYPFWKNRKIIPEEIILILLFGAIYFWGASLIDAEGRQFAIITPILLLGISYMLGIIIKIKIVQSTSKI